MLVFVMDKKQNRDKSFQNVFQVQLIYKTHKCVRIQNLAQNSQRIGTTTAEYWRLPLKTLLTAHFNSLNTKYALVCINMHSVNHQALLFVSALGGTANQLKGK